MSQRLRLNVDAVDDEIRDRAPSARIEIQRDTTAAFAAPTALGTVPLVAGKTQYEFFDATGTSDNYYRFRLTSGDGSIPSDWSPVFRGSTPESYGSLDNLREMLKVPDDSRDNQLSDKLRQATVRLNSDLKFDFWRHPRVSGEEVRLYNGTGKAWIADTQGFLSVSAIRYRPSVAAGWTSLAAGDWALRWSTVPDGPYLGIVLTGTNSQITSWPTGFENVEVTCVRGYATVPEDVDLATMLWAADLYRVGALGGQQGSIFTGGSTGLPDLGPQSRFVGDAPTFAWRVIQSYRLAHSRSIH